MINGNIAMKIRIFPPPRTLTSQVGVKIKVAALERTTSVPKTNLACFDVIWIVHLKPNNNIIELA